MINLNRFDLASLRLYVAVVDAGSLTAGADRFGISLAAVVGEGSSDDQNVARYVSRSPNGISRNRS